MSTKMEFDVLVVGGGIAGLQAALDLADQDFKVAIVEKDATMHHNSENGCCRTS
jgi:heterodisulfide reductase subunit A